MAKRILVVDDETAFLLGIKKVLGSTGAVTDIVETIEEAEKLILQNPYDILITDLRLTGVLANDVSDMSGTGLLDKDYVYRRELFDLYGIPELWDAVPPLKPSHEVIGKVTAEAAAATVVFMTLSAMPMPEVQLTIDRPFFFLIRDTASGQVLFVGRVLNPVQ